MSTETTESKNLNLTVTGRTGQGKNASFRIRRSNMVPGVIYGPKMKGQQLVSVVPNELREVYKKVGRAGIVTLMAGEGAPKEVNGQKVLIKEIQTHPFKNLITHVDLHSIDLTKKIRVTVPLVFTGKAKGLSEGGILSIIARQVEIKCLPTDLPNHIDVDVTDVGLTESIHLEDLSKKYAKEQGDKIEFIYESNYVLVAVVRPEEEEVKAVVAADPAAAGAAPAAGAAGAAAPGAAGAKPGAAPAAGAKAGAAPAAAAKAPAKK
ncbi:MAG: 50S ribosomal protein L25 [Bdellovibrionales bacterium]|nr:50S ribosomal protein L25 [Bdellovibrionales bacterium]